MSTNYEPTPEQVERMTGEMLSRWHSSSCDIGKWVSAEVVRILQRQHERENGLRRAMECAAKRAREDRNGWVATHLECALDAHAALDAPPEPTVEQAQAALLKAWRNAKELRGRSPDSITNALDAWQAAVERAERAK